MTGVEILSIALIGSGTLFFLAGTVGLLRFPDAFTRLHAVTKADNLGLGLLVLGMLVGSPSWHEASKLLVVWLLVLAASATNCHLIARWALRSGLLPWRNP